MMQAWFWILLLVLIVIIAVLWKQSSQIGFLNNLQAELSKSSKTVRTGGNESTIADEVLDLINPYIRENGLKNIINYLHDYWAIDKNKIKAASTGSRSSGTDQNRYLAFLIQFIVDDNDITDSWDFIRQSSISWKSFCTPAQAQLVLSIVHPYSSSALVAIRELIDSIADQSSFIDQNTRQSVLHEIENKRIYKIKRAHVKKSIPAVLKAARANKDAVYEPDLVALGPLIQDALKSDTTSTKISDITKQLKTMRLLQSDVRGVNDLDDLIRVLKNIKPVDVNSYLQGRKDSEMMFSSSYKNNQAELEKAIRERADLQRELDHVRQQLKDSQNQVDECRRSCDSRPDAEMLARIKMYEDQIADYDKLVNRLESDLRGCEAKVAQLERDLDLAITAAATA